MNPEPFEVFTAAERRWIIIGAAVLAVFMVVCWRTGCMVFD